MSEDKKQLAHPLPQPPVEMIYDIAYGLEEPVDVAFRYGYSASEYAALEEHRPFVAAVMQARADLEKDGHAVKVKSRWMTERLIEDVYMRAKNPATALPQVLDAVKVLSKLGDLEPRQEKQQAAAGPGTSVQIIFSGNQADVVIGQRREEEKEPEPLTFDINMPEKPDGEN